MTLLIEAWNKSECVLVHTINNESALYLIAGIYLMMRFKWSVNKVIDYLCVKQPWFYIVPQFHKALCLLEDLLRLKYQNEVTGDWELNREMSKHETIITHTFINTRIPPIEYKMRNNLDTSIPRNNRNANQKSNTYNNVDGSNKKTTKILWADLANDKKPLTEIIVNKIIDHGK